MGRIGTWSRQGGRPNGGRLSARELYRRIVGEGGVSPEYFHRHMTFCEADDYLAGLHRRYHPGWEMARMQADVAAKCAGNKEGLKEMVFPWESETKHAPEVSEEERRLMEAEAREWERRMNEKRAMSNEPRAMSNE